MKKTTEKFELEKSTRGHLCFWEHGGGMTNTGYAAIVADKNGQAKRAIYVKRRGHLANDKHALIPVVAGDFIINAHHHRGDFTIRVYKIIDFIKKVYEFDSKADFQILEYNYAVCEETFTLDKGEWNVDLPNYLGDAVDAAVEKATCYHCRRPHFIINNNE